MRTSNPSRTALAASAVVLLLTIAPLLAGCGQEEEQPALDRPAALAAGMVAVGRDHPPTAGKRTGESVAVPMADCPLGSVPLRPVGAEQREFTWIGDQHVRILCNRQAADGFGEGYGAVSITSKEAFLADVRAADPRGLPQPTRVHDGDLWTTSGDGSCTAYFHPDGASLVFLLTTVASPNGDDCGIQLATALPAMMTSLADRA